MGYGLKVCIQATRDFKNGCKNLFISFPHLLPDCNKNSNSEKFRIAVLVLKYIF